MPICGRLGLNLALLVTSLVSGFVSLSFVILLDMFANGASDGINAAPKQSSFVSRNIQYWGIPPVVVVLWVAAAKFRRHLHAGGTDGVDQSPPVQSQLEELLSLHRDRSPRLHSTGSSVITHEVEMPNRICCGSRLALGLLGQVTGLTYLFIKVLLAMFANQASHGLREATKYKTVLRNIQFLLIPCIGVGLCVLGYTAVRCRVRLEERRQPEASATDQLCQSQASTDGEGQTPVAFDQASLISKHCRKFTRSFEFLGQLWRNIRKQNPGHPHSEPKEGVSSPMKTATQSKADEMIEQPKILETEGKTSLQFRRRKKKLNNSEYEPAFSSRPQNWETRTTPPDNVDKLALNDSVYELRTGGENPEVEVIFFHGLQPPDSPDSYEGAYWKTWLSRDGTVVWPQKWLGEHLPKARILSISFDSAVLKGTDQHADLRQITENLITDIIHNCSAGQRCPVILVGHSLGGIIIKQFILNLANAIYTGPGADVAKMKNFLKNCRGVFYYSTPQSGTNLTKYLEPKSVNLHIVNLLKVLGKETARINDEFSKTRAKYDIKTAAIFELLDTRYLGFKGQLVPEASNRVDLSDMAYTTAANHFEVCKPQNKYNDNILTKLVDFVENQMEATLAEKAPITRETVMPMRRNRDNLC